MNTVLEQKLKELIDEAERRGAPAMHTVLHLLYASYIKGKQNDFAKHCCRATPLELIQVSVTDSEQPEEWLPELGMDACEEWHPEPTPEGYVN